MDTDPTGVVRELLEAEVGSRKAASVFFEALTCRPPPRTIEELVEIVRGPLRASLARKVAETRARMLVDQIVQRLTPVSVSIEVDLGPQPYEDEDTLDWSPPRRLVVASVAGGAATTAVPLSDAAVRVAVVSATRDFERALSAALGPDRVAPSTARDVGELERAVAEGPPLLLVDATAFPDIPPGALVERCAALPSTSTCVLWGSALPRGRELAAAAEGGPRAWVTLAVVEGLDPLLDLVRSRRRAAGAAAP